MKKQKLNFPKTSQIWLRLKPRKPKVFSTEVMNSYRQRLEHSWKMVEEGY